MKKIRYMIILLLFVIGFLFNGELFALYIDNFQESFYRSTFAFDNVGNEIQLNEIIEDFNSAAKENKVDFFMIDSRIESTYSKVITIYGTEDAFKYIESKGIHNKEYLSILMGTIDVNFVPFDEIKNMEIFEYCYYVGDATSLDDMRAFKSSLIDKYGGGFPKLFGSDRETKLNIISVWSIIIFLMSLLLIYEILLQKKEIALKVVLGEDIKMIFLKNILSDCSFIISTFAILLLFLSRFSNVSFMMNLVMKLIGISLIIAFFINLTVFRINFKKHFARSMTSGKLLIINYAIKSLITGLVILLLSSNIVLILYGINYFKQQDYFNALNQYSYFRLNYKVSNGIYTIEDDDKKNLIFYNRFMDRSIMSVNLTRNFNANYPVVLLNKNAMEMLSMKYPELSRYLSNIKEEGKYIFKPSSISNDSESLYNAKLNLKSIYNMTENEIPNAIPYNSHIEVVGIMNQVRYQSENLINPIIIYDNEPPKFSDELATGISSFAVSIMYDIDNEEIQDFINEFGLEDQIVSISNVQDVFEYNYTIAKRSMKFNLIIAAFLMILEISMISIIIRMEFRYNAIELALKKIYGYTVFERFSKLVTVTVVSLFFSGLIILIVSRFVNKSSLKYILFEMPILLFIELALIYLKAISLEQKNYVTILKGERI